MGKIVAKRKLRKSYFADSDIIDIETSGINGLYKRNGARKYINHKSKKEEVDLISKIKRKMVFNISVQSIFMIAILVFVLAIKYLNIKIVKESEICKNIVAEFNKNYTVEEIMTNIDNFLDKAYLFLDPIIPDSLSEKSIAVFNSVFSGENNSVKIYEDSKEKIEIYEENSLKENKEIIIPVSSSISTQDEYIQAIKETKIEFVKPTSGVITSNFGAREEIFEGTEAYHYGTDIANNIGTAVYSSIDGKVISCSYDEEVGNYIEVQNGKITTRYFHLYKQLVKKGDTVKKGQKIGKMGDTGLVTGPHLHFEIMYDKTRVDAEKILKLD